MRLHRSALLPIVARLGRGALLLLLGSSSPAQDWPQFRGPQGRGVSPALELPTNFEESSPELKWKVALPGAGLSSPVVSDGRVFLTTAYESRAASRLRDATLIAVLALGAIAVLATAIRSLRPREESPGSGPRRWIELIDAALVLLATILGLGVVLVGTLEPDRFWAPGNPGDRWLVTSTASLVGLFAAFGCFPARSAWRCIGAAVLVAGALYAWQGLPLNKHHHVYKLEFRLAMVAPGFVGALWHAGCFGLARTRSGAARARAGWSVRWVGCVTLAAMSLSFFTSANFLNPDAGLARVALAYDVETGEPLWETPIFVGPEERLHPKNGFATPTPCALGSRVLVYFGPRYACLDWDGRILWEGEDESYYEQSHYGAVSSPIAFEDGFILMHESERADLPCSWITSLGAARGEARWRIEPEHAHESYMTPALVPVGGEPQLVTVSFGQVVAYDPRTGESLWSLELPTWQHVPSLCFDADRLFVAGGAHQKFVTAAIRLHDSGARTRPEVLWQTTRKVPNAVSPVLYDGLFYTLNGGGVAVCYEPESGEELWSQRLDGNFFASLVAADGKLWACSEEGSIYVLRAGRVFELLSRAELGEPILATPAIAGRKFLVRTGGHLWCFEPPPLRR